MQHVHRSQEPGALTGGFRGRAFRVVRAALLVGLVGAVLATTGWFWVIPHTRPVLRGTEVHAIDVSNHQREIDWDAVADDGIGAAYLKATEGRGYVDAYFARNWAGASAAGVRRGAYHFFTLCASGSEQAANFLRTAPPEPTALPPALDLEVLSGGCQERPSAEAVETQVAAFVTQVEAAWGRRLLVYARGSWTDLYPLRSGADNPKWETSFFVRPTGPWAVWQVHYLAEVDGITGRVDLDVLRPDALA